MSLATVVTRGVAMCALVIVGVGSIIGSSAIDEDEDTPDISTDVAWSLASTAAPLTVDSGDHVATLDSLRLAGSYESFANRTLSINRNPLDLDTTSGFRLVLSGADAQDLSGTIQFDVLADLDYGAGHDPVAGQFQGMVDGTTGVFTVQTSPAGIEAVVGTTTAQVFTWSAFRALKDDTNAQANVALASFAFALLERVIELAIYAQDIERTVDNNRRSLESMGVNQALSVACNNTTDGQQAILWRLDAAGSGQGSLGSGDSYEAELSNCRLIANGPYRDGVLQATNYVKFRDSPRELGYRIELVGLLFSNATVPPVGVVLSPQTVRLNGGLLFNIDETPLTTTALRAL